MVLIRGGKKASLAAALDGLQGGLAQGFAMGTTARRTQLAEREQQAQEERYKQSVALASQAAALDKQREDRIAAETDRNNRLQDEQRQGMHDLTESRIDSITPDQTAASAPRLSGIGPKSLAEFGAGLMQNHDRILKHAKETSKRLPAEVQDRFWSDVKAGLVKTQQDATVAKLTSDLETFRNASNTELGGGPVKDLVGEPGDGDKNPGTGALGRFDELKSQLDAAKNPNMDPEMRQQIINAAGQAIGLTRDSLRHERVRRNQVAAISAHKRPLIEAERAHAMSMDPGDPLSEILIARADEKDAVVSEYEMGGMSYPEFSKRWQAANQITLPTSRGGAGSGEGGGPGATDSKSLDRDAQIRARAAERADKAFEAQSKLKDDDPNKLPWQSIFAREYQMLGGQRDKAPEQGAGAPGPGGSPNPVAAPGGALEKTLFDPAPWKKEVQKLAESGNDIDARALFLKNNPQLKAKKKTPQQLTDEAMETVRYENTRTARGGM